VGDLREKIGGESSYNLSSTNGRLFSSSWASEWAYSQWHISSNRLYTTVPFTSVYARKYVTKDKSKTDITKTKHRPEKANNTKDSKTKLPWFSCLLRHSARKRGGLILQHSRTHMGLQFKLYPRTPSYITI